MYIPVIYYYIYVVIVFCESKHGALFLSGNEQCNVALRTIFRTSGMNLCDVIPFVPVSNVQTIEFLNPGFIQYPAHLVHMLKHYMPQLVGSMSFRPKVTVTG